jgi:hypothetical protein
MNKRRTENLDKARENLKKPPQNRRPKIKKIARAILHHF